VKRDEHTLIPTPRSAVYGSFFGSLVQRGLDGVFDDRDRGAMGQTWVSAPWALLAKVFGARGR